MTLDSLLSGAQARDDLVVDASGRYSLADVEGRVRTVAAALGVRSVKPGDRVASRLPVVDAMVAYRACWRIGAVAVALHPAAGSHDLERALAQARPAVTIAAGGLPPVPGAEPAALEESTAGVPGVEPVAPDEMTAEASSAAARPENEGTADSADAVVIFTSGSTGTPRGVVHTHRSLGYLDVTEVPLPELGPDGRLSRWPPERTHRG